MVQDAVTPLDRSPHPSVYLTVRLSVRLSVCPPICPSSCANLTLKHSRMSVLELSGNCSENNTANNFCNRIQHACLLAHSHTHKHRHIHGVHLKLTYTSSTSALNSASPDQAYSWLKVAASVAYTEQNRWVYSTRREINNK